MSRYSSSRRRASFTHANPITVPIAAPIAATSNASATTHLLPTQGWLWYARNIGITLAVSLAFLYFALRVFGRLEDNFAEEI